MLWWLDWNLNGERTREHIQPWGAWWGESAFGSFRTALLSERVKSFAWMNGVKGRSHLCILRAWDWIFYQYYCSSTSCDVTRHPPPHNLTPSLLYHISTWYLNRFQPIHPQHVQSLLKLKNPSPTNPPITSPNSTKMDPNHVSTVTIIKIGMCPIWYLKHVMIVVPIFKVHVRNIHIVMIMTIKLLPNKTRYN